jgi:hypothetical protein
MKLKRIILNFLWIIIWNLVVFGVCLYLYCWWNPKPVFATDYFSQYHALREPENYSMDDDGTRLLIGACTAASYLPRFVRYDTSAANMNDAERTGIRAWIAENKPVLELVERAMARKYILFVPRWPGELKEGLSISEAGNVSKVSDILIWRGRMKAWDGDPRGGLADILMAAAICEHFGDKLTWTEWRAGAIGASRSCTAISDIVKAASLDEAYLATLSLEVQRMSNRWEDITWPIAFERLVFLENVQRNFTDDGHGDGRLIPRLANEKWWHGCCESWTDNFLGVTMSLPFHPGRKATIECYDKVAASYKDRWGKIDPNRKSMGFGFVSPEPWTELASGNRFVLDNMPGDYHSKDALWWKRLEAPRALLTIAVARYKAATGHLPDGLGDVVTAGYMKEIPMVWYNGEEFIYEKNGGSFAIYASAAEKKRIEERRREDAEFRRDLSDPNQ